MAVPFSNTKLRVPQGFRTVMWVFTREVIRDNPKDINEYGACFFDKLVRIRKETGHDPSAEGAHSEDKFYNNYDSQESAKTEDATEQKAEDKTEEKAEENKQKEECKPAEEEKKGEKEEEEEVDIDLNDPAVQDAAVKIQAQFKGFKVRKALHSD